MFMQIKQVFRQIQTKMITVQIDQMGGSLIGQDAVWRRVEGYCSAKQRNREAWLVLLGG